MSERETKWYVRQLLVLASEMWAREFGPENYFAGQTGTLELSFTWEAEAVYLAVHKDLFPSRWSGPSHGPSPWEDRRPVNDLLPEDTPADGVPCLYAHIGPDESWLYVGQTIHARQRQVQHRNSAQWWDDIVEIRFWPQSNQGDLVEREVEMIRTVRPRYNKRDNQP